MTQPPGLLARTVAATFLSVVALLSLVFVVLTLDVRDRVRASEAEKLLVGEQMFTALEARWRANQLATVATLAENPTLKAALDTYDAENSFATLDPAQETLLRRTVAREAEKIAAATGADALAVLDVHGRVLASAGRLASRWTGEHTLDIADPGQTFEGVVVLPSGAFRISGARLNLLIPDAVAHELGTLVLATSLDEAYANELAGLSRAGILITVGDRIAGSTVPEPVARELLARDDGASGTALLDGEEYAVRTLLDSTQVRISMLSSVGAAARTATTSALRTLAIIALGGLVLAGVGSFWLARTVTAPINDAARAIAGMTARRNFAGRLKPSRSSREIDALTSAFNELMGGITAAEDETRAAYVGAIRALAAALDTRDPYTAGHSERVSALSVRMARGMGLTDDEVDVIRLGALLHDVGKIGVRDMVLRKPGALTEDEYEQIKQHPTLGARILREVPFLTPHLPIVELHHERPDGKGYPYGLRGDDIPLAARIVHVADAFDAMTGARAYRPGRPSAAAIEELRRHMGTQFDAPSVEALCAAVLDTSAEADPAIEHLVGKAS
jgi:putative nucleotidyltransferase with HDIG domain